MSSAPPPATKAILLGGLTVGTLDILEAFLFYGLRGIPPMRILQHVASGALGRDSFAMGWPSATLGLAFHFVVATGITTVYWLLSRRMALPLRRPVLCGLLYGLCAYGVMNLVVVPLSRASRPKYTTANLLNGLLGHALLVGLPAALCVSRYGASVDPCSEKPI